MTDLLLGDELNGWTWPDDYAHRFLAPIAALGTRAFARNVDCRLGAATVDGLLLPFTVTEYAPDNSYICSPFNHYVTYAREELRNLGNRAIESAFGAIIGALGRLLDPPRFDRVVMVNNWLLSTNLYPEASGKSLVTLAGALAERFPDHAILFRSLDRYRNAPLVEALGGAGGTPVFSRMVWYQAARTAAVQQSRDFKNDLKLLRRAPYEAVPVEGRLSDAEVERLVQLYGMLYLEKYSRHNPQFTPRWLRLMADEGLMRFTLLARDGRIDGVYGYFERNGVMAQPFLGYDTTLPRETALYRMLSALILLEAARSGNLCHASSGVGRFKKLRGAVGAVEYNAVLVGHLPPERRRPWTLLRWLLDGVAVPIIRKGGY